MILMSPAVRTVLWIVILVSSLRFLTISVNPFTMPLTCRWRRYLGGMSNLSSISVAVSESSLLDMMQIDKDWRHLLSFPIAWNRCRKVDFWDPSRTRPSFLNWSRLPMSMSSSPWPKTATWDSTCSSVMLPICLGICIVCKDSSSWIPSRLLQPAVFTPASRCFYRWQLRAFKGYFLHWL